jgi:hypothetical protein
LGTKLSVGCRTCGYTILGMVNSAYDHIQLVLGKLTIKTIQMNAKAQASNLRPFFHILSFDHSIKWKGFKDKEFLCIHVHRSRCIVNLLLNFFSQSSRHQSSSTYWWLGQSFFSGCPCKIMLYVVWAIYKNCYYVTCDWCFRSWHMAYFMSLLEEMLSRNGFSFNAKNKPQCLFS